MELLIKNGKKLMKLDCLQLNIDMTPQSYVCFAYYI